MKTDSTSDSNSLILAVTHGDREARQNLLLRHRERLRRMTAPSRKPMRT
jgi:hypothetical protein